MRLLRSFPFLLMFLLSSLALAACGDRDLLFGTRGSSGTGGQGGGSSTAASRVDVLLVIDNSRGMVDKQEILAAAVPDLIEALVNPLCVDEDGVPASSQPSGPAGSCSGDTVRQFKPLEDLHLGVISTSLGGHGADACDAETEPSENDQAHLLDRMPAPPYTVPTYDDLGFLAWDPGEELSPPGESDAEELADTLSLMVQGVGQTGCGYEAQLESWYRFLIDPDPYETITVDQGADPLEAIPSGTDLVLLEQRRNFLRPDSVLLIIVLSDENDCSIRDGGQYFFAAQIYAPDSTTPYHLPPPRAACAEDPNDPCCRSCGQSAGSGCDTGADTCGTPLSVEDDQINLRCYDQKRRFGIDFLYPIDRYVTGLTDTEVHDRSGDLVQNPLFRDLDPDDDINGIRSADRVFFASILGVPWQDIARRSASGKPDLAAGQDAAGNPVGGFQTGAELAQNGTWDIILGTPAYYHTSDAALPEDPLMHESIDPRDGFNPVTGDPLAPPSATSPTTNPINGHERTIEQRNDLQYACIFELPEAKDCSLPQQIACECTDTSENPLCQDEAGAYGMIQYRAKAYPSIRQLQVLEQLGDQAALGSVCPAQLDDATEPDFGYRPFIRTAVETIRSKLAQ